MKCSTKEVLVSRPCTEEDIVKHVQIVARLQVFLKFRKFASFFKLAQVGKFIYS